MSDDPNDFETTLVIGDGCNEHGVLGELGSGRGVAMKKYPRFPVYVDVPPTDPFQHGLHGPRSFLTPAMGSVLMSTSQPKELKGKTDGHV